MSSYWLLTVRTKKPSAGDSDSSTSESSSDYDYVTPDLDSKQRKSAAVSPTPPPRPFARAVASDDDDAGLMSAITWLNLSMTTSPPVFDGGSIDPRSLTLPLPRKRTDYHWISLFCMQVAWILRGYRPVDTDQPFRFSSLFLVHFTMYRYADGRTYNLPDRITPFNFVEIVLKKESYVNNIMRNFGLFIFLCCASRIL